MIERQLLICRRGRGTLVDMVALVDALWLEVLEILGCVMKLAAELARHPSKQVHQER